MPVSAQRRGEREHAPVLRDVELAERLGLSSGLVVRHSDSRALGRDTDQWLHEVLSHDHRCAGDTIERFPVGNRVGGRPEPTPETDVGRAATR